MWNSTWRSALDKHTCPRRSELFSVGSGVWGEDTWRKGTSFSGHEKNDNFRSCSYCGSIHPDDFMRVIVDDGWIVEPTDKSYKAYLARPFTQEERERYNRSMGVDEIHDLFKGHHRGESVGKFYYQHLSEVQMRAFIDFYNGQGMKIGYPGHFYQPPFFMRLGSKEDS